MHRSALGLLARLYGIQVGCLAVAERRHDSKTGHRNFLRLGGLGGNFARHLREHDGGVRAAECHVVAQDALEFLVAGLVLHKVESAHLLLEGGGLFLGIGERREHRIGRESLDAENRLDGTRCAQAVARHHLRGTHAHIRIVFAKEILESRNFSIVVLARAGTVSIHVTDIGLVDAGVLDGAVDGLHQAHAIFARGGNVVRVARNAGAKHLAISLRAALLGMFVGFHDDNARTFTERNAIAAVKRGATVLVERMERKETGIRHGSEGIRTARNHHVGLARADEVAGDRDGNRTRRTRVRHVRHDAACATGFSHLACDGCNRHLRNFCGIAPVLVILFNGKHATHATADNYAHALVVTKIRKPRIGEGLVRGLDAELRDAVLLFGCVNLVERVTLDFGSQVRVAILCI